jgi:hypothetical protein
MNATRVLLVWTSATLTMAPAMASNAAPASSESTPLAYFTKECDTVDEDDYSCLIVAGYYERGEGAPKDASRAAFYYKKAADKLSKGCARGNTVSCEQIKHACAEGEPVCAHINAQQRPSAAGPASPPGGSAGIAPRPVSLLGGTAFLEVVDALRQRAGRPTMIIALDLNRSWVDLKAEDPQHAGKVDEYQWKDGTIRDPRPVALTGVKLRDALFALDDVDLGAIPALLDEALKRVNAPGARVTRVLADRDFSREVQIRVILDSDAGGRVVTADRKGRILKIQ